MKKLCRIQALNHKVFIELYFENNAIWFRNNDGWTDLFHAFVTDVDRELVAALIKKRYPPCCNPPADASLVVMNKRSWDIVPANIEWFIEP